MAWRRTARRTGRSSNFRRRPRTHEPKRSGLWQRGQFALAPINTVSSPIDTGFTALILAQIYRNLDDTSAVGESHSNQVKYLEIGGIVFDWQIIPGMSRGTTAFFDSNVDAFAQIVIASDRLDADGNPAAPGANWFTNTTPVGVASATETQDEDHRFPTRVHYRHAVAVSFNEAIGASAGGTGTAYPAESHVIRTQGSKSLRLRLRLDDEHALVAYTHLATDGQFPSEGFQIFTKTMLVGSIYYRLVY